MKIIIWCFAVVLLVLLLFFQFSVNVLSEKVVQFLTLKHTLAQLYHFLKFLYI